MSRRHLIVFGRAPRMGAVKTRLAAQIGAPQAFAAYLRLFEHTLRAAAGVEASRELCLEGELLDAGSADTGLAEWLRQSEFALTAQRGGDLGARMAAALDAALERGEHVVLAGTDCPVLSPVLFERAFGALAGGQDAVFAPAEDGGYLLVGLSRRVAGLFDPLPWGTDAVMGLTRDRLRAQAARWQELDTVWDVDTIDDYRRWLRLAATDAQTIAKTPLS